MLLAEIDNIDSLADKMLELMQDNGLAELLVANSYDYQLRQQEKNAKKIDRFNNILKAVYHNKYDQMPLPQELLLN